MGNDGIIVVADRGAEMFDAAMPRIFTTFYVDRGVADFAIGLMIVIDMCIASVGLSFVD